jgi:UDP-2,4-diacetamido-2,4,6-trideoxy-beta-L-altropyranose hydrolase
MLALIRTDAASHIGTGHVMRCLTLAQALREQGVTVEFICRLHAGHLLELIQARGFVVHALPASISSDSGSHATPHPDAHASAHSHTSTEARTQTDSHTPSPTHAHWLGCDWQLDAAEVAAILCNCPTRPDWLILDHYALDANWQAAVKPQVRHLMVIDDLADRPHLADLLLDQNLWPDMKTRYASHIPPACVCLLGPAYALLQAQYAALRNDQAAPIQPRPDQPQRLFAFFGGVDAANLSGMTLQAFLALQRPDLQLDLVLPGNSVHNAAIEAMASGHRNAHLHSKLPTLAPLMAKADLALGAGGSTTWERLCLLLPALVVTVAQNQEVSAQEQHRLGLIHWLGGHEHITAATLEATLRSVLQQGVAQFVPANLQPWVDGQGAQRVVQRLLSISS